MSQNFRFAAAKIRLFLIPTIFFGQNFSNILYLFENQHGFFLYLLKFTFYFFLPLHEFQILNLKSLNPHEKNPRNRKRARRHLEPDSQ